VQSVAEGRAAERWRLALGEWGIPQDILDKAPRSPWHYPPKLFAQRAEQALEEEARPSRQKALEALPAGGTVLDVGVGGGAASLPLVPPAGLVIGVDSGAGMLEVFAEAAERRGVAHEEVEGDWPAVAGVVPPADVVVCNHVFYNVADLVPFATALTDHARHRVVVELSGDHPTSNLNPLWRALHGLERPTAPLAEDAAAVLTEMGLDVGFEEFERPWHGRDDDRAELVAMLRCRLCVGPERDAEIESFLDTVIEAPMRRLVTLWWDGSA